MLKFTFYNVDFLNSKCKYVKTMFKSKNILNVILEYSIDIMKTCNLHIFYAFT